MTTATSTDVTTVIAIYEAFGQGDVPSILDRMAENVRFDADWADHHGQRAGVDHLMPRVGPAQVAEFFALVGPWTVEDFTVLDVIGSGRQVVAEIRAAFTLPNGGRYADEELHLWTLDDAGRVVRFRHYVATAKHIAAAAGEDTTAR